MSDDLGYQWIIDPAGNRWQVMGLTPIVAHLKSEDGTEINVGRSILRNGFASGAWKFAEFEPAPDATVDG